MRNQNGGLAIFFHKNDKCTFAEQQENCCCWSIVSIHSIILNDIQVHLCLYSLGNPSEDHQQIIDAIV